MGRTANLLGVSIVFDNGVFGAVPIIIPQLGGSYQRRRESLGDGKINDDGNLIFTDGTVIERTELYGLVVSGWYDSSRDNKPSGGMWGPPIKFRK